MNLLIEVRRKSLFDWRWRVSLQVGRPSQTVMLEHGRRRTRCAAARSADLHRHTYGEGLPVSFRTVSHDRPDW